MLKGIEMVHDGESTDNDVFMISYVPIPVDKFAWKELASTFDNASNKY